MSGFDTGVAGQSVIARAKQHGSVLRGTNPPVPAVGVAGDLYVNSANGWLYERRAGRLTNPWGYSLFAVPAPYLATLKWFSASKPGNSVGVDGDLCLVWGTYDGYGISMRFWTKAAGVWPDTVTEVSITVNALYGAVAVNGVEPTMPVLTGLVQEAAIALFPTYAPASWPDFVSQYVGDPTSTDGTYQTVFVVSEAPIGGAFWQLLNTYFTVSCGFTAQQAEARLAAIWALAPTLLVPTPTPGATPILTGQVQKAALALFPANPPASWPDFVSQYAGDPTSVDGSYQSVFITAEAPAEGHFWDLLDDYFQTSCGFTSGQSLALLESIWALAPTIPL